MNDYHKCTIIITQSEKVRNSYSDRNSIRNVTYARCEKRRFFDVGNRVQCSSFDHKLHMKRSLCTFYQSAVAQKIHVRLKSVANLLRTMWRFIAAVRNA